MSNIRKCSNRIFFGCQSRKFWLKLGKLKPTLRTKEWCEKDVLFRNGSSEVASVAPIAPIAEKERL
jgi:hypothetical protein